MDRALRHLLTDITGNTHRAEFCIDKLYSPDSLRGRLGLLELRGFEMAPHPEMALVQALLVRALLARFAEERYSAPLVRWGTRLHERFLLPHFAMADIAEVVADLRGRGFDFDLGWLAPYQEFRFPRIGLTQVGGVTLELRSAIEPWHVLGEESSSGGTARYVDSSTERIQVLLEGFVPERHLLTCNGVPVPLTPDRHPGHVRGRRALQGVEAVVLVASQPGDRLAAHLRPGRSGEPDIAGRRDVPRRAPGRSLVRTSAGERLRGRGEAGPPLRADGPHRGRDRRGRTPGAAGLAGDRGRRVPAHPRPAPARAARLGTDPAGPGPSVTVLGRYLAGAHRPASPADAAGFDEFAASDGTVRSGWSALMEGLDEFADTDLLHAQREVARLLEDDNVTYTPSPTSSVSIVDGDEARAGRLNDPRPWRLDPLPLILSDQEWAGLEAGLVQRAELLNAVMADLYGPRRLLARRHLPATAVLDHEEYLRPVVGMPALASQRLFMIAADLGRDSAGQWKVISDRTQAPSGAGFAMQNRRVLARVLPEIYHQANLHRLTPFFQAMRLALVDAAPSTVEDPRVVVLSPGTHSETAFDQAFMASLLGFPLLEGSDLTVRDGRVWMRVLGKLEQVDVILRRVDSTWMDALELRPGSRLGVTGLLECVRQGTVSIVNNIGSGILENPALLPFLPDLCERLLGQSLRLPSVQTWWCGDPASLSHVLTHLDSIVVRPISRGHGRSVRGTALSTEQRELLVARIKDAPHRFVGQEVLQLSSAPTSEQDRLVSRQVVLRSFAVRSGDSYTAMLGGLARVTDDAVAARAAGHRSRRRSGQGRLGGRVRAADRTADGCPAGS